MIPFSLAILLYQLVPFQPELPCDISWYYSCHSVLLFTSLVIGCVNKRPDLDLVFGHAFLFWVFGAHLHLDLIWMGAIMASIVEYLQLYKNKLTTKAQWQKYIEFYPFIGVYIGTFGIPLDWDVHWQYFPYLSLILSSLIADMCWLAIKVNSRKVKIN